MSQMPPKFLLRLNTLRTHSLGVSACRRRRHTPVKARPYALFARRRFHHGNSVLNTSTPTPNPSPQGGGERSVHLASPRRDPAHTRLWLPSHNGLRPERLQVQKNAFSAACAFHSIGVKPDPLCEPSQNGWDLERPQAHHQ